MNEFYNNFTTIQRRGVILSIPLKPSQRLLSNSRSVNLKLSTLRITNRMRKYTKTKCARDLKVLPSVHECK